MDYTEEKEERLNYPLREWMQFSLCGDYSFLDTVTRKFCQCKTGHPPGWPIFTRNRIVLVTLLPGYRGNIALFVDPKPKESLGQNGRTIHSIVLGITPPT